MPPMPSTTPATELDPHRNAVNETIGHPQPRHIRLALDTLQAAGTLTPEAHHALLLAGAHYRAVPQYDSYTRLLEEREQHAQYRTESNKAIAKLEQRLGESGRKNAELNRKLDQLKPDRHSDYKTRKK